MFPYPVVSFLTYPEVHSSIFIKQKMIDFYLFPHILAIGYWLLAIGEPYEWNPWIVHVLFKLYPAALRCAFP